MKGFRYIYVNMYVGHVITLTFCMLALCQYITGTLDSGTCMVTSEKMVCYGTIPKKIPKNVTDVKMVSIASPFNAKNFSDTTWKIVTRLELADEKYSISKLFSGTFRPLLKLEYLELVFHSVSDLDEDTFTGLSCLRYLVFSNFRKLSPAKLLGVFNNSRSFPNISSLQLRDLNPIFAMNETFYRTVSQRNISELIVHSYISSLDIPSLTAPSTLQKLDLSHSHIEYFGVLSDPLSKSLRYADISGVKLRYPLKGLQVSNKTLDISLLGLFVYQLRHISTLKLDYLISLQPTIFRNVTVIYQASIQFALEDLSAKGNMIKYLDIKLVVAPGLFDNLTRLQVQDNGIEFVNPQMLAFAKSLTFLNISNNRFGKMQRDNKTIFSKLFIYLEKLQSVDLSRNGLTAIPVKMYDRNKQLKALYVRHNSLTQFSLKTSVNLTILDLFGNNIRYLNSQSMAWLQNVYDQSYDKSFKVNLMGNPLQCSCEAVPFLKWFISSKMFHFRDSFYSCKQKGVIKVLTHRTVQDLISLCTRMERVRLYFISTCVPTLSIAFVSIGIFFVLRKLKRKQRFRENIGQLKAGTHKYKYPVFLSYSSADGDFVLDQIYGPLLEGLQHCTGTAANLVCVGELHFKPGHSIHEEVIRCLEMSGVFLSVITPAFCTSSYCKLEFERAYSMKKPILQMYKSDVDEGTMWPLLRKVFKRYTRIKVLIKDDKVEFHPGIETICTSILELM